MGFFDDLDDILSGGLFEQSLKFGSVGHQFINTEEGRELDADDREKREQTNGFQLNDDSQDGFLYGIDNCSSDCDDMDGYSDDNNDYDEDITDDINNPSESDENIIDCEKSQDNDGIELSIPISVSVSLDYKKERPSFKFPATEIFKYYSENYQSWDLRQALIDQFPELKRYNNSQKSHWKFNLIIQTEFKREPKKAIVYWEWLLAEFPFEIVLNTNDKEQHSTAWSLTCQLFDTLVHNATYSRSREEQMSMLYKLQSLDKLFRIIFADYKWIDVDTSDVLGYLRLFIYHRDYTHVKKVYEAIIDKQDWLVEDSDLDEFWEAIIRQEESQERERQGQYGALSYSVGLSDEAYDFFLKTLKPIENRVFNAREMLKGFAPDYSQDAIENELYNIEIKIKGLQREKDLLQKRLQQIKNPNNLK